jgi:hypothetical protein
LAAVVLLAAAHAQAAEAPTRYMVSEKLSLVVEGQTMTIGRDGQRAMSEQALPARADLPKGQRSRAFYDLNTGLTWTVDLIDHSTPCGASRFTGDWGDPFTISAGLIDQLGHYHPTRAGAETVNGIPTEVSVATTPDGQAKVWVDPRTGLLVKWVITPPKGPPQTMIEVTSFSLTPPPPAAFAIPPKCR